MPYGPHTAGDRERMLAALGIDLGRRALRRHPRGASAPRALDLPPPEPELELAARLTGLAARNRTDLASFLGAGVYRHWSPPAVDQILLRGEWYTAYTPYQPEVSQGTLQSIYEYESLIAELVDLDVVSASHYDGAAATAEAALMTCRATRRERVLVSRGVHPHYRETLRTYFGGGLELDEIPLVADGEAAGTTDLAALERMLAEPDRPVAGVIAAQPDFLGLLEPMPAIGELAHAAGALFVAVIEPVSLAVLAPPGAYGADIAAGEGQPLGIAPQYGGPYLGLLASTDALVRQIPGRLVGHDHRPRRPARLRHDDARARAGHPPRQGGQQHLHEPGAARAGRVDLPRDDRAARAARRGGAAAPPGPRELEAALAAAGAPRLHPGPYLNEFAVRVPDAPAVHRRLLDHGVLAGLVLADADPRRPDASPTACWSARPRSRPRAEIARFAEALGDVLRGRPPIGVEAGAGDDGAAPGAPR